MKQSIRDRIISEIEERIKADPSYRLPRLVDIAQHYGISYPTAWKAVRELTNRGVIAGKVGRRLSVGGGAGDTGEVSSSEQLFRTVRERILDGTYLLGRPLPKAGQFVSTEGVSYLTVSQAFVRLAAENLVHKQGRRWTAGPDSSSGVRSRIRGAPAEMPAVIVLTPDLRSWVSVFDDGYNSRFMLPFSTELSNRGARLVPALPSSSPDSPVDIPGGIDEIRATVQALGDQYMGMLILPTPPVQPSFRDTILPMLPLGRPVVFFDSTDTGGFVTRASLGNRRGVDRYYRFHLDENSAVALALDRLGSEGHRTAALHSWQRADWSLRRTTRIQKHGSAMSPPVTTVNADMPEDYWGVWDQNRMSVEDFVARVMGGRPVARQQRGVRASRRRFLTRKAASLVSVLKQDGVTALVAMDDHCAFQYSIWLSALRIKVPGDVSIVSFDNLPQSVLFPISTIDYGFERLGYLAAHVFIGDIDVPCGRDGNVPGVCRLMDRGSIGKPAARGRLRKLLRY